MIRTLRSILLPALVGLGLLALIGLAGSALVLIREAGAVHPILGWGVGMLLAAGIFLLGVLPVVRLLRLPRALVPPGQAEGPEWEAYILAYGRRLQGNPVLGEDDPDAREELRRSLAAGDATAVEAAIRRALVPVDRRAREVVARHAAAVFAATAVSQSGRLDTGIVISAQLRMVKEVAGVYSQRPGMRELVRLYANVGSSAFVAGEIQDSELLAILGAPVTAGITSFIPVAGADPLVSLMVSSLLDGSANAFLTLRVGSLARRYSGIRIDEDKRLMARSASVDAAGMLGAVVSQGASRIAKATRRVIQDRAMGGTTRAARGVADLGISLVDKVASLAGKAGTATAGGLRTLQETLRFWETVAETVDDREVSSPAVSQPVD